MMADSSDDRLTLFRQQVRQLFTVVILIKFMNEWYISYCSNKLQWPDDSVV